MELYEGMNLLVLNKGEYVEVRLKYVQLESILGEDYYNLVLDNNSKEWKYSLESFSDGKIFLSKEDMKNNVKYICSVSKSSCRYRVTVTANYSQKNTEINNSFKNKKGIDYSIIVKDFFGTRNINNLYHFTNINNIESILSYGLLPRKQLLDKKIPFRKSDVERWDKKIDCSCLSLSHPNTRYLHRLKERNPNSKYCILEIDIDCLKPYLEIKNVFYSKYNAARSDTNISNDFNGLLEMFCDSQYLSNPLTYLFYYSTSLAKTERTPNLPLKYTTNDQAELLLKGIVKPKFIKRIIFENDEDLNYIKDSIKDDIPCVSERTFFQNIETII